MVTLLFEIVVSKRTVPSNGIWISEPGRPASVNSFLASKTFCERAFASSGTVPMSATPSIAVYVIFGAQVTSSLAPSPIEPTRK